jgi:hypothetical protein
MRRVRVVNSVVVRLRGEMKGEREEIQKKYRRREKSEEQRKKKVNGRSRLLSTIESHSVVQWQTVGRRRAF